MNEKKKTVMADLALLLCALIWGLGFVATDLSLSNGIGTYYTMAIRFGVAFVLMAIIFFKKLKKINKQDVKAGVIVGIVLFLAFTTQTVGLNYTTPGKQSFLTGLNVVMVPFFYWFVKKKKPDNYTFAATFICLLGMGLLSLNGEASFESTQLLGDGLTVVCAVFFAMYIIVVEHFTQKSDPIIITVLQMATAMILSVIAVLISGEGMPTNVPTVGWAAVFYLGAVSTMVAYIIQNSAQKYTTSTHAAIILSLESVFGALASVIILGELFTVKMVIGCAFILVGLITAETKLNFLRGNKKKDLEDVA
ncbi:Permease of the drug/metabolite transporter (DMT) superfamily [Clostridium collagenovorans DSM 3089]|uniref:Permease of the drug/metabolite transporter (DMT) superfamily n=1 Tax=Clostridium collagenovorans DSM 3089 TaxID=1121306 RepID=A0A1M5W6Q7_9CLOT|nr:DMT family transporter [Clostridium collagenovorans]SHH83167.1 Permease of the drug/metabolite transporter (DMT) superfamily [Clostridium collagenovorans DSM 3089]